MTTDRRRRALIETFEARILYSADPGPAGLVAAALAGDQQVLGNLAGALQQGGSELVFIDSRLPDVQQLLDDIAAQQRAGRAIEAVVVGGDDDGIAVIGAALAGRSDVSAVHVVGHGSAGVAELGASRLDAQSVFARADEIAAWGNAFGADGDLLLYGCDVGADDGGRALVTALAQLTGADVAASDDPTGSALLGGDWALEVSTGAIEASPFASATLQADWSGVLALTAQGPETRVNTTLSGSQTEYWSSKTVAMDANGNYVVIWQDGSGAAGDAGIGLYGQRYNASGVAQGSQFHINTGTSNNQQNAQVAMSASGSFVVVWESNAVGGSYDIYAQRYNSSGVAQGGEFRVNTTTTYEQAEAAVAMDANGNFVVVWQSYGQDALNTRGIYGQRYDAAGTALGGEFLVNTYTFNDQTEPSVAMDSAGNFVVAWQSYGQDGSGEGIYAQRFNSSGAKLGSEFHVSNYWLMDQDLPMVSVDASGRFVIVWESYGQDGDQQGVYGQRYDATGAAQGGEFRISSTFFSQQQNPVVQMLAGGGFAVTWQSMFQDGSFDGVYLRQYDGSGSALTGEILVNSTTFDYQDVPSIAGDANGHMVVVWHGNGPGDTDGVFMQRYTYATAPVITLSGYTGTYVENATVIYDANATVTDSDTPIFNGGQLVYRITANGTATDELGIRNVGTTAGLIGLSGSNVTYGGTIIGTYSGSAGAGSFGNGSSALTVNLNANASVAAVQALVRSVTFRNTSENPSTATRTISLTVSDGTGMTSAPAIVSMAVTAVNDAPVITSASTVSVAENKTAVLTVTSTDVDGGTPVYTIVGGADAARFQINTSTGALSFITAPDYEAPTDVGANNVYDVTVQVSDGAGGTATRAIAVTVTDVSSALVVTTTADTNDTGLGASFNAEQLNASKGTDGRISLREAIIAANNTPGTDTISFNIPDALVSGTHTIKPTSALPTLTGAVIIDGTTEPDYVTGRPVVELDGSLAGAGVNGLVLGAGAGGSTIRGIAINSFNSYGLYLMAGADNNVVTGNVIGLDADGTTAVATKNNYGIYVASAGNTIGGTTAAARNVLSNNLNAGVALFGANNVVTGNYIGTDATGTLDRGNQMDGVDIGSGATNSRIGGTTAAERNIISGNDRQGIELFASVAGTVIQGNYIGTDVTGNVALGNTLGGIWVGMSGSGATIGGTAAGAGNRIFNNAAAGILSDTNSVSFAVLGNTFYNNTGPAIDLKNDGVTANDTGDADTGPNSLQNFPVLTRARVDSASQVGIAGTLNSSASSYYRIEFYASATQDSSGYGEGQRYLGYVNVATDASGNASFDTVLAAAVSAGEYVSATATRSNASYSTFTETSEFGANRVAAANQAPVVSATSGTLAYAENAGAVVIDAALAVTDADNTNLAGATVTIASGFVAGQDALGFVDQSGITGSWNASTGVLTLSGSASVASYRTALRSITFINTVETPTAGTRSIAFAVTDGVATSGSATRSVAVSAVNDAPSFKAADFIVTTPVGSGAERGYATVIQPDGKLLVAGYASNGSNLDFMLLRFNVDGRLDTSFGGGDGIVTTAIGAGDDEAHAVAVQQDGKIVVGGFTHNGTNRDFALVRYLSDGTLDTRFGSGGIVTTDFGASDEAWSLVVQSDGKIVLGGSAGTDFAVARYNTDGSLDAGFSGDGKQTVDIAGGADTGYGLALQADGRIVQAGSATVGATLDFAAVRYNTDGSLDTGFSGDGIVTTAVGASFDIAQSVALQADGKIVVGGYASIGSSNDFAAVRYTASGALDTTFGGGDGIATLDFSGGLDAAWSVALQSDGRIVLAGVASGDMAVARLLADGTPDTAFSGDGKWTAHVGSSQLYGVRVGSDGRIVAAGFTNSGSDDVLTVRLAADGQLDTRANPAQSSLGGAVAYTENGAAVLLDGDVRIYDAELSAANGFAGATLSLARSGGASTQDAFFASGNLGVLTQGGNLTLGGTVIGTVTTNSGGALLLTFNASATQARVNEAMSSIAYANTSDAPPASVQLTWRFSDGNGGAQGSGGALTATGTTTVNITAVNDAPVITSTSAVSVAENTTAVLTVTSSDVDGGTPVYAIVGGVDSARFQINGSTGALSFVTAPDYEAPADVGANNVYNVSVQVSDGAGGTASYAIAVTVTPVNDNLPVITSAATASVAENTTAVLTVTATDADLPVQTLSYSIAGGADQAKFSIDAVSGALRFITASDYEARADAGGDNVYDVNVRVSDGAGGTATYAIAVTVTPVNDNTPVITSAATASVAENTTAVLTVTATDADLPAQTLTYRIVGGADQAKFSIDASSGVLRFVSAPDFESPTDAGANNIYDVVVEASDGARTTTQAIAVTVTPANEFAPTITSSGGAASVGISVAENAQVVTTVTATDADLPGDVLTFSIAGGADAALFQIDPTTGLLRFAVPPDFELPADAGGNNVYDVIVQVSDGTHTDTQALAVTVTDVASELIVTTAADIADGDTSSISALLASKGADGKISLREAILAANNTAGPDDITFAIGSGAQTINLASALPYITSLIHIRGESQLDFAGQPLIELNGAGAGSGGAGLWFVGSDSAGSSVSGLVIDRFLGAGIRLENTSNVTIAGNYLGTNLAGTASSGNEVGVLIMDSSNNLIGGTTAAERNLISGNTVDGVQIFGSGGATGNRVVGNYIGLDVTGSVDLGNAQQGVAIFAGASSNIVGGTTAGARNVISGNDGAGVQISGSGTLYNVVEGNYVGTNAAGTAAVGNSLQGVKIDTASGNTIGGAAAGAGNLISGNLADGVLVMNGAVNTFVQGNIIGLDASGSGVIANGQEGIEVSAGASGTWIGGTTALTRNIIAGNAWQGIGVYGATTDGTVIRGNWIGTGADGTTARGNARQGIAVSDATHTMIGGSAAGEGNVIANAGPGHQGVSVYGSATGATIIGNSIYGSGALGIDLGGDGVTANDAGDGDAGVNNLQNTPVLTSATTTGAAITIAGTLNSVGSTHFRIEFFANPVPDASRYGEGASYLGFVDVLTDAGGNASFNASLAAAVPTGQVVTATATRLTAGMDFIETSEFAADIYTNAPVITSNGGGAVASVSVPENTTAVTVVTAIDPDGAAQTLTYSLAGSADQGRFTINSATGALAFTTARNFELPADADGDNVYEVVVRVEDGTGAAATQALAVTVTNVNDAPVISFVSGSAVYPENAGPVIVAPSATVSDEDSPNFDTGRLVVQITANGQPEDRLAIRNQGTANGQIGVSGANVTYGGVLIGTWSGGTSGSTPLVVSFNANATLAAVQALGRNITYEDVSDNPSGATRTLAGYIEDGDGATSNVASGTITVVPSNDPPVITSNGGGVLAAVSVAENTSAVTTVGASDVDSGTLVYAIAGGADSALFHIDSSTGALSFVTPPDFETPADSGATNVYHVIVSVSDGAGGVATQALAVTVTPVNDNAPAFTSPAVVSVAENTTPVVTAHATDADLPGQTISYSIAGGDDAALFQIDPVTGALRFIAAPDFETPLDSDGDNIYEVLVRADDNAGLQTDQAIAVTITDVNDNAPNFTSPAAVSVAENTTPVVAVRATDDDLPGQTVSYSIVGGADATLFQIDTATGELRFAAPRDFETPVDADGDNVYEVVVRADDNAGLQTDQAIAVTITPVDEYAPVFTSPTTVSVAENTTSLLTVHATDADLPALALTYSIAGGADAALFQIDATTGALRFIAAPDYDAPQDQDGDNVYEVIVRADDNAGLQTDQAITVTVTALNDNAPVFTSPSAVLVAENTTSVVTVHATDDDLPAQTISYSIVGGADAALFQIDPVTGALSFITAPDFETQGDFDSDNVYDVIVRADDNAGLQTEQSIAVTIAAADDDAPIFTSPTAVSVAENNPTVVTVQATDADLPAQTITYSVAGGADAALFQIDPATGALSFIAPPDFEMPGDFDGDNVYEVIVRADDNAGLQTDQSIAVTVTAVNDNAPFFTSPSAVSVAENTAAVVTVQATDADLPAQVASYSIVGGADAALFQIDAVTGALSFIAAPDFEMPLDADGDNVYDVIVRADDSAGLQTDQAVAVTVTSLNDNAPIFTTPAAVSVAENTSAVVIVQATDADLPAQVVNYSIVGGADAALFQIDAVTGALSFIAAPDFETPVDFDGDNVYEVVVRADDNGGLQTDQSIAVAVTPVNDNAPNFTSPAAVSVAENTATVITVHATDADLPTQVVSYSVVGGADAALFQIDAVTGALSFISAPDFETPLDANGDNVYEAIVRADDNAGLQTDQTLAVTVTALNDNAPIFTSPTAVSVAESTAAFVTVHATDADLPGQTISYSIVGGADATLFQIDPVTGALRFVVAPDFELPLDADGDNVYDVIVRADDNAGLQTDQTLTVTVTALNDNAPIFTSPSAVPVAENTAAVVTVHATDADLPAQTISYSIVGGADAALFQIDALTGALRFIAAPDFEMPLDSDGDNVYDVIVHADDNAGLQTDQILTVTVTALNDNAPIFTSLSAVSVAENTAAVVTVQATDADLPAQTISYSIVGGADAALFQIDPVTGALSFISAPDFEMPGDFDADNVYDVIVRADDSAGLQTDQAVAVTVTALNDNVPIFTSPSAVSVAENTAAVVTVHATDADQLAQTVSYSIVGGADATLFQIDAVNGTLSFIAAPDFELPLDANGDNVYEVIVRTDDSAGLQTDQALTVTVTALNDNAPIFTSPSAVSVAENTAAVVTVQATDAELPGQTVSYSIVGGADSALFQIDPVTGALRFIATPDFEMPLDADGDNVYDVIVRADDNAGLQTDQSITVTVSALNDNAPIFTSPSAVSVAENTAAVVTVHATDADKLAQTVSYSIVGGADAALFQIDAVTGALRFIAAPDFEMPRDADGDNVYDVIVRADDNAGLQTDQTLTITVTALNDNAPIFISPSAVSVAENTATVVTVHATDADLPVQTISYSIVGGADAALFQIDPVTGALRFIAAPDFEMPLDANGDNVYEVIVRADDNAGLQTDQPLTVTVTALNDNAPAFTTPSAASVAENTTPVITVHATDADLPAQTLSYSIVSGADAALFQIDPVTGALRFVAAPDFEMPRDADGDNIYAVVVQASDGNLSSTITLAVSVANRNEMPQGSDARIVLAEDGRHVFSLADFGFDDGRDAPANRLAAVQIVAGPLRGSLLLAGVAVSDGQWVSAADLAAGLLVFAPAPDANGSAYATLGFRVRDDGGSFDGGIDTEAGSHTLSFDVTPVNDAPMSSGDTYVLDEDVPLVVSGAGVLANDSDTDGDPLSAELVSGPAHGSLVLAADGSFRYTPAADWNGTDSFAYRSFDGVAYSDAVQVTLVVRPVNDAPTMVRAELRIVQGGTTALGADALGVTDVDSAPSTLRFVVDAVSRGHFELVGAPGVAIGGFDLADLSAGRVRFVHDEATFVPTATLHATDGLAAGASLGAQISYASSVVVPPPPPPVIPLPEPTTVVVVPVTPAPPLRVDSPAPAIDTATDTASATAGSAGGSAGATAASAAGAIRGAGAAETGGAQAARAAVRFDVPVDTVQSMADASAAGLSAVRRISADVSLVKFEGAQITLTLGAGTEGPLMEFMLAGEEATRAAGGSSSSRQANADKAKLPPLRDDAYADVRVVLNAAELSGIALSVGAVWWATRAGGLVASLLMAAPAWRTFDPLPVLGPQDEEEGDDWGETIDDEMERDEMGAADVFGDRDVMGGNA